ncbi:NGG1p interacting factor NIF3 [Methylomonas sp. MgM2]
MYQLCFYVPGSHLEQVKNALFAAGAGKYQDYDHCAWQTLGHGQYRPLRDSQPYIGKINEIESVPEYKVEMICLEENIRKALQALLDNHPYEQPAYSVIKILKVDEF